MTLTTIACPGGTGRAIVIVDVLSPTLLLRPTRTMLSSSQVETMPTKAQTLEQIRGATVGSR